MTHFAYLGNGQNYHVQKWLPALAEQGLRVTLFTFHPPTEPLDGVEVQVLRPPLARFTRHLSWLDFWKAPGPLRKQLAEIGADVLMGSYATHYGWMGARTGFRPFIAQTWTFDVTVYPFEGWKRRLFGPVVQRVLQHADVITTDGVALAEVVRARYPAEQSKVVGVRWGIRLADYEATSAGRSEARAAWHFAPKVPVVVSPRGVAAVYQPEVVLPALHQLLERRADVQVMVLTLGQERTPDVQVELDRLAAHPRARVVDRFLSKKEIRTVWVASDVLVSAPARDGISESVLEGMYAGAYPVLSDIPSNRSLVEEGVRAAVVPEATSEGLTQITEQTVDRLAVLKAEAVPANRQWVTEHASVEGTARMLADIVRSLHRASKPSFQGVR